MSAPSPQPSAPPAPAQVPRQPYVVPSTRLRDFAVGGLVAAVVVAAILWGVLQMSHGVMGSALEGVVTEKTFTPYETERVTFGQSGVHAKKGDYVLECDVKGKAYLITVDEKTWDAKKIGDKFLFARPAE